MRDGVEQRDIATMRIEQHEFVTAGAITLSPILVKTRMSVAADSDSVPGKSVRSIEAPTA